MSTRKIVLSKINVTLFNGTTVTLTDTTARMSASKVLDAVRMHTPVIVVKDDDDKTLQLVTENIQTVEVVSETPQTIEVADICE